MSSRGRIRKYSRLVPHKTRKGVIAALEEISKIMPFPVLGPTGGDIGNGQV